MLFHPTPSIDKEIRIASLIVCALVCPLRSAEVPKVPVPNSPYIAIVYRYADTMVERGRDTYGPQKTGLFLSALDRATLGPLTNQPPAPTGIREGDRVALPGANPQHDENFLRLLYTLSELSAKPKYRDAANAELRWFLQNAASPATKLLPWGEQMSWNVLTDEVTPTGEKGLHGFFRPWLLWPNCFEVAPEASERFALGLWDHQIADQSTGAFDRHARFETHGASAENDFPRDAGFYIRTWAVAYAKTKNNRFLNAIEVLLGRFEKKRNARTGLVEAQSGNTNAWVFSTLSLAIDCDGAARYVSDPLASRLRLFAAREDEVFCSLRHDLKGHGGFIASVDVEKGKASDRPTPLWTAVYGGGTTAQEAMLCVSRYDNTGKVAYRELITAAADAYLGSVPGPEVDAWPATFGHAISLQLAAWRHTARPAYLARARKLADLAVEKFWGANPLPKASLKSEHYETITGADTLALALTELHLNILHITAVRCPPNTIDR